MKRCLLLLALLLLPGCDVAVAALLLSGSDSSDDDPVALTSTFGPVAKVWLANIPDDPAAQIERANLVNQNGNPTTPVWTELGQLFVTDVFDPEPTVTFNAILIQVSEEENFNLDAIEVLDAAGDVVGHATGSTYASFVQPESEILNAPDGVCAVTAAAGDVRAFIFTLYPSPVDRFRINLRGANQPPLPGDVLAQSLPLGFAGENQRPGGLAVDANGIVYLTHARGDTGHLTLFNVGGLALPTATQFGSFGTVQIAADLATAGSHGVAVDSAGVMYTACSITTGIIQVRRIVPGPAPGDNPVLDVFRDFSSGVNGDRTESNGIALDQSGNVVVVGGFSSVLSGRNHWRVKIPNTVTGTAIWQSPAGSIDSSSSTYWHAVTAVGDETVITGDLFSGQLLGGTNQIYTSFFDTAGVASLDDSYPPGENSPDVGNSVALDSSGNIYLGGYATTGANGRNGILVRYEPGFSSGQDETIQGVAGLDDEILDISVDTDGSIYVVGYETTAIQGENMFVRKYTYDTLLDDFIPIWQRTHDGGGDDRAVSVVISGNYLVVAGYETEGATTKTKLRVYAK